MRRKLAGLLTVIICSLLLSFIYISAEQETGEEIREWTIIQLFYNDESYTYAAETVNLYINGARIESFDGDMPPIILNDRVYLPVRDVFEMLGAVVSWNTELGQVFIGYGDKLVALRAGVPMINADGILIQIPLPPKNVNGRLMAPVAFIADVFGFTVEWFAETRTILIDSGHVIFEDFEDSEYYDEIHSEIHEDFHGEPNHGDGSTVIDISIGTGPIYLDRSIDASPEPLTIIDAPKTDLISIEFNPDNPREFYINASGPISRVEKFLLYDNRLVLDFYNMEKVMDGTEIPVNSGILRRLRVGQNQVEPELITRVVFDLLEPVSYSVAFSEDRRSVVVNMLRNEIIDISFESDGYSDFIHIKGRHVPVVNIFPQTVQGVFIIDVPLGYINNMVVRPVEGVFAAGIRAMQFNPSAVRISVDMKDEASHSVTYEGDVTTVRLTRPTHQNIRYDSYQSRLTIPKSPYFDIDIDRIVQSDEYLNFEYSFTLPGDFGGYFGEGNLIIRDQFINHISVSTANGRTSIRFFQRRIMAYTVWEDAYNIYIQAMLPKDKYPRIVVIDPGHGGSDPGTQHNNLVEKHLNLDIALRLASLLENNGIKTYMTRKTDTYPTIPDRAALANEVGDLMVIIHNNAFYTSNINGTETFFWPNENEDMFWVTSERASEILLRNIVTTIGTFNRGSKEHPYRMLRYSEIPTVFIEYAFLSNPSDAARLRSGEFLQRCAEGTFRGIQEIFRSYTPERN